jgi:hypothetical protein
VQQVEVAFAPMRGSKTEPGDERERQDKNGQSDPVHVGHGIAPIFFVLSEASHCCAPM